MPIRRGKDIAKVQTLFAGGKMGEEDWGDQGGGDRARKNTEIGECGRVGRRRGSAEKV